MEKRWVLLPADEDQVKALQRELQVHAVIWRLLVLRGISTYEDARKFFRPKLEDLHDPFEMKSMQAAIDRITLALEKNERILIYGDYDVDGTTAVALTYSFFKNQYSNIDFYIPDRYTEGYGISFKGIDYAKETGCALIIALDCGIKSNDKVDYATKLGIDFIICDHHLPGDEIPKAVAVLDPKRPDCNYPYKELSGCGIGFKLIQAFAQHHNMPFESLMRFLDLVVVSIASDIVPITGENRILAFFGLEQLNTDPRPGFKALIETTGFDIPLNISNIVFGIGPRINAAGRLDDAKKAVRMLISETVENASENAGILNNKNIDRKQIDKEITAQALQILYDDPAEKDKVTTVLYNPEWHKGVIGIVASRLLDHFYRPTILLSQSHGLIGGSARSIKGFDIYEAIRQCSDLLEQFGGHMFAAGLSLKPENLEKFKFRFEEVVRNMIRPEQLIPEVEVDAIIRLKDITPSFFNILRQFSPFGPKNMYPVFVTNKVTSNGRTKIVGDNHLKLGVKDMDLFNADAIAFQKGDYFTQLMTGRQFDICYAIEENNFNDMKSIQLNVKEIKLVEQV